MLLSLNWLREYVDIDADVDALCETLTMLGLEIESVSRPGDEIQSVFVGQIESIDPHPDADKLVVCKTRVGEGEPLQIVCGAKNMKPGDKIPTAVVGGSLPGGFSIAGRKMRGVESQGMMCSARELGLGEDHSGLMILDPETPVGADVKKLLGLDDVVLEIEVTPNRGDWASMLGVARELAAVYGKEFRIPQADPAESGEPTETLATIRIDDPEWCPRYIGRVIRGVKVGPSPEWLVARLAAAGQRPINNIVDITNFVLLETGHPLHAFDLNKVGEKTIVVRRAKAGETMKTLDGESRTLNPEMLVIADAKVPVALAGIMGGEDSEVSGETVDILLESAVFHPGCIRATSRAHNLVSESSQRFQRGADYHMALYASTRAAQLILDLAGGCLAPEPLDVAPKTFKPNEIQLRFPRTELLLGDNVPSETQIETLKHLGFEPVDVQPDSVLVRVPSWRVDCTMEADLIEEVARLHGYDKIPQSIPRASRSEAVYAPQFDEIRALRDYLVSAGLTETMSWTFTNTKDLEGAGLDEDVASAVPLANPLSENYSHMRPSLIPSVLNVVSRNVRNNSKNVAIFEVGPTYELTSGDELPHQEIRLAAAFSGETPKHWSGPNAPYDFYDAKGYLEGLLESFGLAVSFEPADTKTFTPGQSARIVVNGDPVGVLGAVAKTALDHYEIDQPVYLFELRLAPVFGTKKTLPQFEAIPAFPPSLRDLAVLVDQSVPAGAVCAAAEQAGGKMLKSVSLFDIYSGKQVPAGKKSVALGLVFQSSDKTLTDKATQKAVDKILHRLKKEFDAQLR